MSELQLVKPDYAVATTGGERFEQNKAYLQNLIDGKLLPKHINTVQTAFTVAEYGRELGFSVLNSFHFIIPITGKMTLSALAIGALLRKAGVEFECIEDAVWVYADGKTALTQDRGAEKPIDRRTSISFVRGRQKETVAFYWNDAVKALLTTKENWVKMPREMMYARALTKGAKRIAQDIMLGLYETGEILDYTENPGVKNVKWNDEGGVESVEYTEA